MQSAVRKGWQSANQRREENLKPVALEILKTMLLLGKPYGHSYVARILRGVKSNFWKDETHTELETFGAYHDKPMDYLVRLMHLMVEKGLLEPGNAQCNTLKITDSGKEWIENPEEWVRGGSRLGFNSFETFVRLKMREFRRQAAEENTLDPWQVFTDYSLDRMIFSQPTTYEELGKIPGMNSYKCERFGIGILSILKEAESGFGEMRRNNMLRRAKNPRCQTAKRMFESGSTFQEIADALEVQVGTVTNYMMEMHEVEMIDLVPWIETNLNSKALYKGVEYFKKVSKPTLREAYETLGLDYETLRFCRLYVADHKRREESLQVPA